MKAAILKDIHSKVEIQEYANPILKAGEVLIKLSHAALNHRDVWIQKGQYAAIKLPVILGSDGCGTIVKTHDEVDSALLNQTVVIQPGNHWGQFESHQSKEYSILGMPSNGTFAEYICVDSKSVYPKPEHLTNQEAAAIPLAGLTAYRALMIQGQLKPKQKVLVTGIGGGVAQWVMQFAIAHKCEVWITSGDDDKMILAQSLGANGGVNYKNHEWSKKLNQLAGSFDVIIDSACGDDFVKLTDLCNPGGKIVIYGGTNGNINSLVPAKIFWKQLTIIGSTMGSDADFKAMMQFISDKKIKPYIQKTFDLDQVNDAFFYMEQGKQFGKIILNIE